MQPVAKRTLPCAALLAATLGMANAANADGMTAAAGTRTTRCAARMCAPAPAYEILHAFRGDSDGALPGDGVAVDSSGNIYGTTDSGGHAGCYRGGGCGTVFKIAPDGTEAVLFAYDGANGADPFSTPYIDDSGNVYVTSTQGGTGPGRGFGTLVRISPDGTAGVLYSFCSNRRCETGGSPIGRLIADGQGDLFGVAYVGGPGENGVIFEWTARGQYKIFYAFADPLASGAFAREAAGNFYAVTEAGGANGTGTVVRVSPEGAGTLLYAFAAQGSGDGATPTGVTVDSTGNVFGFTAAGGADGAGTIFEIGKDGTESVLYSFTGSEDGAAPTAGPVLDNAKNIYGVTTSGGTGNSGAVFELTHAGKLIALHDFSNVPDGAMPSGRVLLTKLHTLFGTTFYGGRDKGAACREAGCGTVFQLVK
jgi:uncharacterized repeat protein (TIGR03803 family)